MQLAIINPNTEFAHVRWSAAFIAITLLLSAGAMAKSGAAAGLNGCPEGTYSAVNSPDGTTLSILFDNFSIATDASSASAPNRKSCSIQVPLKLPDGYTLGLYKVDYRGFSHLLPRQNSELFVDYVFGTANKSRNFHRKIKGASDGDFLFTETIGAGLMKRIGCEAREQLHKCQTDSYGCPSHLVRATHFTVPLHDPLRVGTLAGILAAVAAHHGLSRDHLIVRLFE